MWYDGLIRIIYLVDSLKNKLVFLRCVEYIVNYLYLITYTKYNRFNHKIILPEVRYSPISLRFDYKN